MKNSVRMPFRPGASSRASLSSETPSRPKRNSHSSATRLSLIVLGIFSLLANAGCTQQAVDSHPDQYDARTVVKVEQRFQGDSKIKITCTTGMVADIVRNVGGAHVDVALLMGEGVDPHLYKPSPGDIRVLGTADVVFYSGLHLEGKMGDLFARIAKRRPVFGVADFFPKNRLLMEEDARDPHVWFDVSLWRLTVDTIRDVLRQYDPVHAETYSAQAESYGKSLDELHQEVKAKLAGIPKDRRVLVTAHDAFHIEIRSSRNLPWPTRL